MSKSILVFGATGQQGGATVKALLASPRASEFTILAVTRNATSAPAKKLEAQGVKIVQGDLDDVPAIFDTAEKVAGRKIWGVFSVQSPVMKAKNPTLVEEEQGKAVVDAALAHNVAHLVYTSVDRGGDAKSYETPTKVPHFISKHNIEHHLVDRSAGSDLSWTILRPVAFMDNLQPGFAGKIFPTAWKGVKRPLQLIAVRDIGVVGAKAFLEPEKYKNRGLGLAGDELNYAQANEVFCKKTGIDMSTTFWFLIKLLFWFVADVRLMFEWFDSDGYGVDIARLRKEIPELLDFGEFIKEQGKFELKKDV